MSNIKKIIQQKVNTEVNSQKLSTSIATVTDVDSTNMLATVKMNNPYGADTITIKKVPIILSNSAIVANTVCVGDRVIVEFVGSSLSACKIIGINYTDYNHIRERTKHSFQDMRLKQEKHKIIKKRNVLDLLFNTNERLNKFSTNYDYTQEYNNIADNIIGVYRERDIGITHPDTKSTIKLNSDGSIVVSNGINFNMSIDKYGNASICANSIDITTPNSIVINGQKVE